MKLKQLQHFVAVVDKATIQGASKAIGITQPALTRSIQALENILGFELLKRHGRRIALTSSGLELYRYAKRIINTSKNAENQIRLNELGKLGQLNIGLGGLFTTYVADKVISNLLNDYSGLCIGIIPGVLDTLIDGLQTGEIDLIISALPLGPQKSNLILERLYTLHHSAFVNIDHPLLKKRTVTLKDTLDAKWLIPDQRYSTFNLRSCFESENLPLPEHITITDSLAFLKHEISSSNYITIMPSDFFADDIRLKTIKALRIPQLNFQRHAGLIYRNDTIETTAFTLFRTAFRDFRFKNLKNKRPVRIRRKKWN